MDLSGRGLHCNTHVDFFIFGLASLCGIEATWH